MSEQLFQPLLTRPWLGKSLSWADSPTIQRLWDSSNQTFPHKNGGMCCVETITTLGSLQEEDLPSYHKLGHELPFHGNTVLDGKNARFLKLCSSDCSTWRPLVQDCQIPEWYLVGWHRMPAVELEATFPWLSLLPVTCVFHHYQRLRPHSPWMTH